MQAAGSDDLSVAVRSSATAEDLPDASFAGQQETFLNIHGIDNVLTAIKHVFASLYNDRAISYRVHKGYIHSDVALSAGVQRMVRSDLGSSGVMFTLDTESGFDGVVLLNAAYGYGEYIVKGGDTGMKIATANGVSVADLQAVNPGVNWGGLKVGQKLKLPKK